MTTLVVPTGMLWATQIGGSHLPDNQVGWGATDMLTYGACWLLGLPVMMVSLERSRYVRWCQLRLE
jgi:hypothetical protein